MNDELPEGWEAIKLEDIASWGSGGTPPRKNPRFYGGDIPWIKTGELGDGLILDTEEKITADGLKNSSAKVFPKGSVAIAMYGATIGKVSILGIDAATNQACAVGIPDLRLTGPQYIFQYLRSQKEAFIAAGKGGAQPNLSQGVIKEWPFPLAPLAEQKRIADKLEAVLGRVDACRARLDRVPALLKRFRQSVLAAATSGRLTEEWRMTNGVNDEWEETEIQYVAHISTGSTPSKKEASNYGTDFPFVKPGDLDQGEIFETEDGLSKVGFKLSRQLRKGAVLVSCIGNLGKIGIAGRSLACNQQINAVEFDQRKVCDRYGYYFAHTLKEWLEENASATTIAIINKGRFSAAPMAIPSLPEQQEIVRRVEDLFAFADRIEARLATAQKTVERLTPATLAKAFRGELVPQDPNDEPASVLLGRLRPTESSAPDGRGRRKAAK